MIYWITKNKKLPLAWNLLIGFLRISNRTVPLNSQNYNSKNQNNSTTKTKSQLPKKKKEKGKAKEKWVTIVMRDRKGLRNDEELVKHSGDEENERHSVCFDRRRHRWRRARRWGLGPNPRHGESLPLVCSMYSVWERKRSEKFGRVRSDDHRFTREYIYIYIKWYAFLALYSLCSVRLVVSPRGMWA